MKLFFRACVLVSAPLSLLACGDMVASDAKALEAAPVFELKKINGQFEAAQWLADGQLRISADARLGLHRVDAQERVLAQLPGSFEGLDHRQGRERLLISTVNKKTQQVLIRALDKDNRWGVALELPKRPFAVEGLCLFRDAAQNSYLFLLGEEGIGEQWLVAHAEQPLDKAYRVRGLSLPPESSDCQVDDAAQQLFVNEEGVGFWQYPAHPEAALTRSAVDLRAPFGSLQKMAGGLALLPGGLYALDAEARQLHRYQQQANGWQALTPIVLEELQEPERLSVRASANGSELLVLDDEQLYQVTLNWRPSAVPTPAVIVSLAASGQTELMPSVGDAADDPAIWVNRQMPERSRVLGTDKKGGLLSFDLSGKQLQDLRVGRLNNVDLRYDFSLKGQRIDLAVASNRDHNSLHLFGIEQSSGLLSELGQVPTKLKEIYGLCMFKDASGQFYAIANDKDGTFVQYRLFEREGEVTGELARQFSVQSQPEGCVADDLAQRLYVGEEDVAVWTVDARAEQPAVLEKVIGVGGPLYDDIEGLGLYQGENASYLVVSSQGNDSFLVIDAKAPYTLRGAFRIGADATQGIDGVSETDGLDVTSANLGGIYHKGFLVTQDGRKRMPEGNQNYKYLPWSTIAEALSLE